MPCKLRHVIRAAALSMMRTGLHLKTRTIGIREPAFGVSRSSSRIGARCGNRLPEEGDSIAEPGIGTDFVTTGGAVHVKPSPFADTFAAFAAKAILDERFALKPTTKVQVAWIARRWCSGAPGQRTRKRLEWKPSSRGCSTILTNRTTSLSLLRQPLGTDESTKRLTGGRIPRSRLQLDA